MGGGSWTSDSYKSYSCSVGKTLDSRGFINSGQVWTARTMNKGLDPKNVIRECVNTKEHPNTIPVILALDVTGSMGDACRRTAESLGVIMKSLYNRYKDIEIMAMGIGDVEYDDCPIQATQFESDVRIAKQMDKIYMEHGGGSNTYESYSAAWQFGIKQCKLDCWKQGRKGIIITMGDEPLNPTLERHGLNEATGQKNQDNVETNALYNEAIKKFDIYHIAVDDPDDAYDRYENSIKKTFGQLLGDRLKVSTISNLDKTIVECIDNALAENPVTTDTTETSGKIQLDENGNVIW